MSRLDVNQLNVPAEFAAIFDRNDAPPVTTPDDPDPQPAPPPPSSTLLDALASNGVRAHSNGSCPKCNSVTSAVEAKMGRCLTCGTVFAGGTVQVGI